MPPSIARPLDLAVHEPSSVTGSPPTCAALAPFRHDTLLAVASRGTVPCRPSGAPPSGMLSATPTIRSTDPRAAPPLVGPSKKIAGSHIRPTEHGSPYRALVVAANHTPALSLSLRCAHWRSPLLGSLSFLAEGKSERGLGFGGQRRFCSSAKPSWP
jgi:hypothetical protein